MLFRSDAKLTELAKEWHRFIDLTPLEGEEVLKDIHERQSEMRAGGGEKPGADTKKEDEKKSGDDKKPADGKQ